MAKRRSRQKGTERKLTGLVPTGDPPQMDEADGVRTGQQPVLHDEAAVHLSRTSRNHRTHRLVPLRTIHRFTFFRQDHPHLGRQ